MELINKFLNNEKIPIEEYFEASKNDHECTILVDFVSNMPSIVSKITTANMSNSGYASEQDDTDLCISYEELKEYMNKIKIVFKKDIISRDCECEICCDDGKIDKQFTILCCGHIYHTRCIEQWYNIQFTCPVCRRNLFKEKLNL